MYRGSFGSCAEGYIVPSRLQLRLDNLVVSSSLKTESRLSYYLFDGQSGAQPVRADWVRKFSA